MDVCDMKKMTRLEICRDNVSPEEQQSAQLQLPIQ